VNDFLPDWRAWRKVKPRTEDTQESHVRLYIEPRWGRTKAREINRADIVTWLRTMKKQNGGEMNPGTKAVILSTFSSILDYAVQADVLAANPCRSLARRDKPHASAKAARIYTREELAALNEACSRRPWMQDIIRFAYLTGLRLGEIVGLTWTQVDFEKGVLVIDRQFGKDGRIGTPKGNKAASIEMIPDVRKMLAERHLAVGLPTEGPVFPNSIGGHRHPRDVQNAFGRARAKAGLTSDPRPLTFHDLRHTCASMLMNAPGASLSWVQSYLRHGNAQTTLGYVHKVADDGERAEAAGAALAVLA
jgi:integrase